MKAHPYDFIELHDRALELMRSMDKDWLGYEYCCPHTFHLSDGAGDAARMIRTTAAAGKLREVHVSDTFNHRANNDNRYITVSENDSESWFEGPELESPQFDADVLRAIPEGQLAAERSEERRRERV